MGSSHSTRKLTISNEEEIGFIHISNGVAQRLAQGTMSAEAARQPERPRESNVIQESLAHVSADHQPKHASPVHIQPEYTISALKMQQLKEEELDNQNIYWQKRLQNLKDNHAKIDRILEEEYQRAVDQVASAQGKKIDLNSVVPPCLENVDKVLRCYQDHPREVLKCSSLVDEFSSCVDKRRAGLIAARC